MFGRAWPLRAPVRDGYVPTWPQLSNSNNVPCTVGCFSTICLYHLISTSQLPIDFHCLIIELINLMSIFIYLRTTNSLFSYKKKKLLIISCLVKKQKLIAKLQNDVNSPEIENVLKLVRET